MQPIVLVLPFRAISSKNHHQIKYKNPYLKTGPYIAKSDAVEAALELAQGYLRQQYRGAPIARAVHLDLKFEYKNAKAVPDIDNAENFVLDALKGVVLQDDGWKYVGELGVTKQHITNAGADRITIRISVGGAM